MDKSYEKGNLIISYFTDGSAAQWNSEPDFQAFSNLKMQMVPLCFQKHLSVH